MASQIHSTPKLGSSQLISNKTLNITDVTSDTDTIEEMANEVMSILTKIESTKATQIAQTLKKNSHIMNEQLRKIIEADIQNRSHLKSLEKRIMELTTEANVLAQAAPHAEALREEVAKSAEAQGKQIASLSSMIQATHNQLQQLQEKVNTLPDRLQYQQRESSDPIPAQTPPQQQQCQQPQHPQPSQQQHQQHQRQEEQPRRFRNVIIQSLESPRIAGTKIREKIGTFKTTAMINGSKILKFGLEVECSTVDDAERFKRELQLDQVLNRTITVVSKRAKLQRAIVLGIPEHVDEHYLIKSIENIYTLHQTEFKVIRKRSSKTPSQQDWIVYMLPSLLNLIIEDGGLMVGPKLCQLRPHTYIERCRKCQEYFHSGARCDGGTFCAHCGQEGHVDNECENPAGCINCHDHNDKHKTNFPTNHAASDSNCHTYRAAYQAERLRLDDIFKPQPPKGNPPPPPQPDSRPPPQQKPNRSQHNSQDSHHPSQNNHQHPPPELQMPDNFYNQMAPMYQYYSHPQQQHHQQSSLPPLPMQHLMYNHTELERMQMPYNNLWGSQGRFS